jgi:hypothetical protein
LARDQKDDPLDGIIGQRRVDGRGAGDAQCPDASIIAAYRERSLPRDERARCERHFAQCARCASALAALARIDDAIEHGGVAATRSAGNDGRVGWRFRGPLPLAAFGAVAAIVIVVAIRTFSTPRGQIGVEARSELQAKSLAANAAPTAAKPGINALGESNSLLAMNDAARAKIASPPLPKSFVPSVPPEPPNMAASMAQRGQLLPPEAASMAREQASSSSPDDLKERNQRSLERRQVRQAAEVASAPAAPMAAPADISVPSPPALAASAASNAVSAPSREAPALAAEGSSAAAAGSSATFAAPASVPAATAADTAKSVVAPSPPIANRAFAGAGATAPAVAGFSTAAPATAAAPIKSGAGALATAGAPATGSGAAAAGGAGANGAAGVNGSGAGVGGAVVGGAASSALSAMAAAIIGPMPGANANVVEPPDHTVVWMVGAHGAISRYSVATGWVPQTSGVTADLSGGSAPSATACWIVGRAGTILRTVDGERWTTVVAPVSEDLSGVVASSASDATIFTASGRRFATSDGGATWRPL